MRLVSAAARRADMVITDSQHSKKDIVEHLHLPAERVRVIYLAADPACQPVTDESALCAVRRRYGLPEDYLLYLGGFDKRKNLPTLMTAYARAQEAMSGEAPPLAVAGRLPEVETALFPDPRRIAEELHIEHSVVFTGWIAEEDKPAVYGGALFFVSLSLYEGFGLMPLESMSCGTPVLVGRTSSLPEVVGPGGLLVDPMNMDEVVDAMVALIQDPLQRSRLAAAALVQASRFRWEATAEQTLQVYEHVLRGSAANATPVPGAGGHFS
jgi:glycosyltransferase involved in cell wall biosynthesis